MRYTAHNMRPCHFKICPSIWDLSFVKFCDRDFFWLLDLKNSSASYACLAKPVRQVSTLPVGFKSLHLCAIASRIDVDPRDSWPSSCEHQRSLSGILRNTILANMRNARAFTNTLWHISYLSLVKPHADFYDLLFLRYYPGCYRWTDRVYCVMQLVMERAA